MDIQEKREFDVISENVKQQPNCNDKDMVLKSQVLQVIKTNRKMKEFPNCFLSIPILNDKIKSKFFEIQNKVIAIEPRLKSVLISVPTIHLTLKVYMLKDENEINSAKKAMDEAKVKIMNIIRSSVKIDVSGVGSFGNDVVFAKVIPSPELDMIKSVAELLEESFNENGLISTDLRPFNPHITLLKFTKESFTQRKSLKKLIPSICEELREEDFGSESVERVHLCSMRADKGPDGYYQIIHEIELSKDC